MFNDFTTKQKLLRKLRFMAGCWTMTPHLPSISTSWDAILEKIKKLCYHQEAGLERETKLTRIQALPLLDM
jgi:hypothetical protein